ncbi:MAG: VOC family protein [Luteimonas sp.]
MQLIPYLNFDGQCKEAFDFYAKVLGGKITGQMRYRDSPMCDQMPADARDRIMHSQLAIGDAVLMGADGPPPPPHAPQAVGTTINIMLDTPVDAERIFAALAEGGDIKMPMAETFWAQRWGMLVDRYGKPWMVNCMKPEAG